MKNVIVLFLLISNFLSYGQNEPAILNKLDTVEMYQDSSFFHNFIIGGDWEFPIKHSIVQNHGAEMDSVYGFFTFEADEEFEGEKRYYDFIVQAKNIFYMDRDTFTIIVHERINKLPTFSPKPDTLYYVDVSETFKFDFTVTDPEGEPITVTTESNGVGMVSLIGSIYDDTQFTLEAVNFLEGYTSVILNYSDGHHVFTEEIKFKVGGTTDVDDIEKGELSFTAYPNPFQNIVYFDFIAANSGVIDIDVYNLAGQLVTRAVSDYFESGKNRTFFNSSALIPGIYLASLKKNGELLVTIKLIKN